MRRGGLTGVLVVLLWSGLAPGSTAPGGTGAAPGMAPAADPAALVRVAAQSPMAQSLSQPLVLSQDPLIPEPPPAAPEPASAPPTQAPELPTQAPELPVQVPELPVQVPELPAPPDPKPLPVVQPPLPDPVAPAAPQPLLPQPQPLLPEPLQLPVPVPEQEAPVIQPPVPAQVLEPPAPAIPDSPPEAGTQASGADQPGLTPLGCPQNPAPGDLFPPSVYSVCPDYFGYSQQREWAYWPLPHPPHPGDLTARSIQVPWVVGYRLDLAERALALSGLPLGTVTRADATGSPSGVVVGTDPPFGSAVELGHPINVVVANPP